MQRSPAVCTRPRLGVATILLVVLAALPVSAGAATYYIRSDGSDTNAGTGNSTLGAWRTLAKANNTLHAGDVVNVISLNPADTASTSTNKIAPVNSGTAISPIVYNGNTGSPELLPVPFIQLTKSYATVRGFRTKSGEIASSSSGGGDHCVIEYCILTASMGIAGATNSRFSHNVQKLNVGSGAALTVAGRGYSDKTFPSQYDTVRANVLSYGTIQPDARVVKFMNAANHCVIDSNRVSGTMDNTGVGGSAETYAWVLYECYDNQFRFNKIVWDVKTPGYEASGAGTAWNAYVVRSGASRNYWYGDTLISGLSNDYNARMSLAQEACGATDPCTMNQDNHWTRCVYLVRGAILFQQQFLNCSIDSCIFASKTDHALFINTMGGNSRIQNCTFYAGHPQVLYTENSIVGPNTVVRNNILYTAQATSCTRSVFDFQPLPAQGDIVSSNNVMFGGGGSGTAVSWGGNCSAVGSGDSWCTQRGNDCNSKWGDPLFVNTNWDQLDLRLRPGSPAIGLTSGGGDAGAIVYTIDNTAPGSVTNLAASNILDRTLTLTWKAAGDDGTSGIATTCDLRWSTSPITAQNFTSATPVTPTPVPVAGGLTQTYVVTGRSALQTYYFALVTRDEAGNAGPLSNVVQVTMLNDQTPPAAVTDLSGN